MAFRIPQRLPMSLFLLLAILAQAAFPQRIEAQIFEVPVNTMRVYNGAAPSGWVAPDFDDSAWAEIAWHQIDSRNRILLIRSMVDIPQSARGQSIAVHMSGLAAADIYWNGRLIGRNGHPGYSPDTEVPGRVDGHFAVPAELVRDRNLLALKLSSFHLARPVKHTLQRLYVTEFETGVTAALRVYVGALLSGGALLVGFVYFLGVYLLDRRRGGALFLSLAALALLLQLGAEVLRGFINYSYDWHLVRMSFIFFFASAFGVFLVAYVGRQFGSGGNRWKIAAAMLWCVLSFTIFRGFDSRTAAAVIGCLVLASAGLMPAILRGAKAALVSLLGCIAIILASAADPSRFLNRDFYLVATALLALLFLHRALFQKEDSQGTTRPDLHRLLEERLPVYSSKGMEWVGLRQVAAIRGADDYLEIETENGERRLHKGRMSELESRLGGTFVRVHRSYIVNWQHVRAMKSLPSGLSLTLSTGSMVSVSRRYAPQVRNMFSGSRLDTLVPQSVAD